MPVTSGTHVGGMNETQVYAQWLDELTGATEPAPETAGVMAPLLIRGTQTRDTVLLSIFDRNMTADHMAAIMDAPNDPVNVAYSTQVLRRVLRNGDILARSRTLRALDLLDGCSDTPEYHAVLAYLAWFAGSDRFDREEQAAGDGGRYASLVELARTGHERGVYPGHMVKA